MIVADTNVLSEPLRPRPEPSVLTWLRVHADELALTSITAAELRFGALRMPTGARRDRLLTAVTALVDGADARVLSFDAPAAAAYAQLRARREASGRSISVEDTMIAAICLAGGHELATRNARDFGDTGIRIHDPWRES